MTLIDLIIWPFKLLFRGLRYCFTNGWKGLVILGVALVFVLIAAGIARGYTTKDARAEKTQAVINATVPSVQQAPYIVTTSTRYYYAKEATKAKDGTVTLNGYWELINNKWDRFDTITLDKAFGQITIGKR